MASFRFSHIPIDEAPLAAELGDSACGGYASFEGWVRDHNEGRRVRRLEYEAFEPLAVREGERVIAEAVERFAVERAACVHRLGSLAVGDKAVWVGVAARHRHEAFLACRYIIDEVKHRLPIWKKEHYESGDSGWVNCEGCAAAAAQAPAPAHAHGHAPLSSARHEHRARARAGDDAAPSLARGPAPDYSRQTALKEIGAEGQAKLRRAKVLVVGCGGLGVPVMAYLAGAGVGRLGLADGDRLEASNLHRQTLYSLRDVGLPKAALAASRLRALNPEVEVGVHPVRLDARTAPEVIAQYGLVIDCTDNFASKFMLNDVCVRLGTPVIFSSVYQYEGQLQVVRPDRGGPCLRCIWPEATRDGLVGNCSQAGVLGPVPGTFGSLQALEALKLLLDLPGQLGEELLVLDLMSMSITRVRARRAKDCPEHARAATARIRQVHESDVEIAFGSLEHALAAGFEIMDIREPAEVAERPAPSSAVRHVPMGSLLDGRPALSLTGKHLLICATGRRSLAAAQELRSRGLARVFSLRGGIAALG